MPHTYVSQFRAMVVEQVRSGRIVAEVAEFAEQPRHEAQAAPTGSPMGRALQSWRAEPDIGVTIERRAGRDCTWH
jgi:hypothetical protein